MNRRLGRGFFALVALLVVVMVGYGAYNLGVSHGVGLRVVEVAPGTAVPPVVMYPYGWHRPWGFGIFFPFLFLAFWFFVARAIFWGGRWRHRGCYGRGPGDPRDRFDRWHRESTNG